MLFPRSQLTAIEMACTTKQQSIPLVESLDSTDSEETRKQVQTDVYDEDARKYRKYLAQQEALRLLEQRKEHALTTAHRVSFIR